MKTENRQLFVAIADNYPNDYYHAPLALYRKRQGHPDQQLAIIGAGYSDDIRLYRESNDTIIYAANDSLGYCGIQIYNHDDNSLHGEAFVQSDYDFNELERLQPINRAKHLLQYIDY